MVIIRLARSGSKKNPYYFITVADERRPRDGSFIERLGFFNPTASGQEERLRIDIDKINEWISKGAQISERVKSLIKESKLTPEEFAAKIEAKKAKIESKKAAIAEKLAKESIEAASKEETPADEEVSAEEAPVEEEVPAEVEVPAEEETSAEEEAPADDSSKDDQK